MSDEAASVSETPIAAVTLPADAPESFDSPEAATRYFLSQKKQTADGADSATAETELSDEDNAAPLDEAHGEDEEVDPAATPPIERPKSWTESEDAEWQATPRKLQEKIVARELERDNALRRTQNDAAEKLKGLTAKEQQAEQARQTYEAKLPALMQSLQAANQADFADIKSVDDISKMAAEDPFRYLQWQALQTKLHATKADLDKANEDSAAKQITERNTRRADETARLIEAVPEFANKTKLDAAQKAAAQLFRDVGYSDQELVALGDERLLDDHRIQLIIHAAMNFRALQSAKTAVAAKVVPPVQRPGSSRPAGGVAERIQTLTQTFNNSPTPENAHALLVARRGSQRRAS